MREDCFANNTNNNKCRALTVKECSTCNFYKTQKQFDKDKEKARARLKSLDPLTISNIKDKYYKGKEI